MYLVHNTLFDMSIVRDSTVVAFWPNVKRCYVAILCTFELNRRHYLFTVMKKSSTDLTTSGRIRKSTCVVGTFHKEVAVL